MRYLKLLNNFQLSVLWTAASKQLKLTLIDVCTKGQRSKQNDHINRRLN